MNTTETGGAVSPLRRYRERLQTNRDGYACHCAKAVTDGDMAAAIDWAHAYERTCAELERVLAGGGASA